MGWLENSAWKRIDRIVGPAMRPAETVVDFDIASLDTNPRIRIDFVATNRALYVVDSASRECTRIAYEDIQAVMWGGESRLWRGRFWVTLNNGQQIPTTMKRGFRTVGTYVEQRVKELVLFSRHVERETGKGAQFDYRRFSEFGEPAWNVAPDEGVDLNDPYWDAWIRDVMVTMKSEADRVSGAERRTFHASWNQDGSGATYIRDGDRFICVLDNLDDDDAYTHMLMEAGWDAIEIAHGNAPPYSGRRAVIEIEWEPPLPRASMVE